MADETCCEDFYFGDVGPIDTVYAGLPVAGLDSDPLPPAGEAAWTLSAGWDEADDIAESFAEFIDTVDTTEVQALVVGAFGDSDDSAALIVEPLIKAADRFPALRSIFLGAITSEENEMSWIQQTDVTPILEAFPRLTRLDVRGSDGLTLRPVRHEALRTLRFETGGLPVEVLRGVLDSDLPRLERLDLWLGVPNYGCTVSLGDLSPLLSGERLPALTHLGVENSDQQDEIAALVAASPLVARLACLSLALGTFGDEGAEALLAGQPLTHLKRLDLRHHFMSDSMMSRLTDALAPSGVAVELGHRRDLSTWGRARYVTVAE
ncbi:hypothetical protein SAMN05421505_10817 [Sinosporangium album]|uniref:Leucine Rich repeat-containing protein n=1 Tax=Sinosporangium album TaxID=504805 RepID=A0A1G7X373_9ACTN|nr:STM4015 family protein [Sinosporangium album]SDG78602.1 hypothetical protein SAMN05421505_10817 [Sinosporangium album]